MSGRIVLGLGGTVDHEVVWDAVAFQRLVDGYDITLAELEDAPSPAAHSEREIVLGVLRSVHQAVGCELFVRDRADLLAFDARFEHRVTLGGTCVRAALALSRIGVGSTVHLVSISDEVRSLLPDDVDWICSADEDSLDPHIIVQYPAGVSIRLQDATVVASRPNRVILVNDPPNEHMRLSAQLPHVLTTACVVAASGFNTMKSESELRVRLAELEQALTAVPAGTPTVYEDAGFHDDTLRAVVLETVRRTFALHSLNEDEAQRYLGREADLTDPVEVARMMTDLLGILGAPTIMVHTSRYAAVIGADAERFREAGEAGCLMASTRFLHGDGYTRAEYDAVATAPREEVGTALARDAAVLAAGVLIVPGFDVRTEHPTTIGLGDAFIGGVMGGLAGLL
ncbi:MULTISPECIES: ADP-dependent glucokinase/phosphofructokinase [unclassified Actinomyces]|uniref:ADP-dependent glucokinase/phosphofructokinase n=1 Tax=unclassified Actinomyces TaxID=2609248 RepID=UPI00201740B0|nr:MULTISPECIES: ADP-dependent glucokinase/phosphofructokinase [unclassified Actinomyces]MCL3778127.1 6-phosphofructokinase [Actinomyces sp. AC-20-1]MCL3789404.1 6-phosphofructokinase [Actinomyces sp. 187325]MCL3791739.1 6-phosphofructokinase [Actinomyces sp. 186855]MCL3794391.1 6-phosphofructokinase [Actinomyces sp. 217892]